MKETQSGERIHQLDAVRGLLAIGVMVYHVLGWAGLGWLTSLGTYGVYAFFVLSGFALEHGYRDRRGDRRGLQAYGLARIARILPLFALATCATLALSIGAGTPGQLPLALLNTTGLFGFWLPGATSIATGGWSIGIEVVWYVIVAGMIWARPSARVLVGLAVGSLLLRAGYVDAIWPTGRSLADVWVAYTQLPTFLVFFLGGVLGARLRHRVRRRPAWTFVAALAALSACVFFSPLVGSDRDILTGAIGGIVTILVIAGVAVAGLGSPWRGRAAAVSGLLADQSYATYLLHPIAWILLLSLPIPTLARALLTLFVVPPLAIVIHRHYEVPAARFVRALAGRLPLGRPPEDPRRPQAAVPPLLNSATRASYGG